VSVDTSSPKDSANYASFEQDDLRIYYSPKLARRTDVLELDYVRILFRSRPLMTGPEELLATIIMGRV